MLHFTKKLMLMGLGLVATSQKKAEELKKELIKEGNLSEKEGAKFVKDILSRSREEQENLAKIIEKMFKKMNIATLKDIERVEKKIDKLLKLLVKL